MKKIKWRLLFSLLILSALISALLMNSQFVEWNLTEYAVQIIISTGIVYFIIVTM